METPGEAESDERTARVDRLLAEYLLDTERNAAIDFEAFCEAHSEIADELRERFRKLSPIVKALAAGHGTHANFRDEPLLAVLAALFAHPGRPLREDGELSHGAMGIVFEAYDKALDRAVAKKVVATTGSLLESIFRADDRELTEWFLEEARITAQLDHPGVVPIYDIGIDERGRFFFTMLRVRGETLADTFQRVRRKEAEWSQERVLGVILRACETVAFAHSLGIWHRDLKPANMMVGKYGQVYVIDWGLAKSRRGNAGEGKNETTRIGTPPYMPPEAVEGGSYDFARADVYMIGGILYELLTGHPPHVFAPPHTEERIKDEIQNRLPPSLDRLSPKPPPELVSIVNQALAHHPSGRYANMGEFALDLRLYLEGRVPVAHPTGALLELRKWIARNRGVAALLAVSIVLGVAALFSTWHSWLRGEHLSWNTYVTRLWVADHLLAFRKVEEALRRLEDCNERYVGFEWAHLMRLADSSDRTLVTPALSDRDNWVRALDAAGPHIVWGAENGLVLTFDPATGGVNRMPFVHPTALTSLDADPKGDFVVTGCEDGGLRVFDLASGGLVFEAMSSMRDDQVKCVSFHPSGEQVVAGTNHGTIRLVEAADGRVVAERRGREAALNGVDFDQFGRIVGLYSDGVLELWDPTTDDVREIDRRGAGFSRLAVDRTNGRVAVVGENLVRVLDLAGSAATKALVHGGNVSAAAFDAEGRFLATGAVDGTVRLWDASSGALVEERLGHEGGVSSIGFTRDGTLVSGGHEGTVRSWRPMNAPREVLASTGAQPHSIHASPDGGLAWVAGGEVWLLPRTTRGEEPVRFAIVGEGVEAIAFVGALLAVGRSDGALLLCDVDGAHATEVARVSSAITCLDADGERLVIGSNDGEVLVCEASLALSDVRGPPLPVRTRRLIAPNGNEVVAVTAGPGAEYVAAALTLPPKDPARTQDEHVVGLWSFDGREIARLRRDDGVGGSIAVIGSVEFSADGTRIAAGWRDQVVTIFDARTGEQLRVMRGNDLSVEGQVRALAFLESSMRIATGSDDGVVRLFDTEHEELLLSLRDHEGPVDGLIFLPTERALVSASRDGTLRIWRTQ